MKTAAQALTEETDPFCLSPARATRLLTGAPWRRFAVAGDSLAAGTGDPSPGYLDRPWGDRVADALRRVRPELVYLNTGTIGATAADTLGQQIGGIAEFGPDLLHLSCGANDLFRRRPDFDAVEETLRHVFRAAAGTGARVTTFTLGRAFDVPVFPDFPQRVRALNTITRDLAAEFGIVVVEMWDHPLNSRPDLLSADRIHFSTSGQAVMASEVVRGLADVLNTVTVSGR
ncbi:SGNH/GDSL hydrolase family protein [Streptomyces sp. NBC_01498]|uniref:SGNH/GDSL hydrolase family protein n=1 Tax=Streptomyces sp. NBC_01498 TaxID=2975870 RepID=UPI002E7C1786|nr:SGNH/GDSL hydrolase family protein [Streptomyces sp. NBC_01498]WTL23368.1 SGNH/GDSL hydrolase family protein [Streptomyces sp. NBC_01498]